MINALKNNKVNIATCEDTLTSSTIGQLLHMPTRLFWQILRNSCYEKESLPISCGEITDVEFWPSWSAEGAEITNANKVEPDLFIRFEHFDLIIEAKRNNFGGQYHAQWTNEVNSYFNEYHDDKSLCFIALGGCNNADAEYIVNKSGKTIKAYKSLWSSLLREIYLAKDSIERQHYHDGSRSQLLRIIDDVIEGFAQHQIIHTIWLDTINLMSVNNNSIKIFNSYDK